MKSSLQALAITALVSLVLGFLIGFIFEHTTTTRLNEQIASLTQGKQDAQQKLDQTQTELTLNKFAVRSAIVYAEAEKNNYSEASNNVSALFTAMRGFSEKTENQKLKQQIDQVLEGRDATIAGLAKADPAVRGRIEEIFQGIQAIASQAPHTR